MSAIIEWGKHSASDDFWMVAGIAIVLTIAGFAGAFYFFMRKRIMEDTPTSKIRSAAQGYVEIDGTGDLLEGPPIIGPLTGKTCTWYSYKIEERRRSGKNSNWHTLEKAISDELFLIIDDTGQCIIDPEGASVTPAEKDVWYGASSRPRRGPRHQVVSFPVAVTVTARVAYTQKKRYMRLVYLALWAVPVTFMTQTAMYARY
jgi:hypothetical protein